VRALNTETRISMPERGEGGVPHSDLTKCLQEELEIKYPEPSLVSSNMKLQKISSLCTPPSTLNPAPMVVGWPCALKPNPSSLSLKRLKGRETLQQDSTKKSCRVCGTKTIHICTIVLFCTKIETATVGTHDHVPYMVVCTYGTYQNMW
jgi:hypothetical protein